MSERRPHWTDDLIEAVYAELPAKKYQVEPDSWEVHRIIAAVEDWHKEKRDSRVRTHFEGCWRWHNECAEALIEYQQATITRVRDVAENTIILANDAGISYPNVSAEAVLRALDGGAE